MNPARVAASSTRTSASSSPVRSFVDELLVEVVRDRADPESHQRPLTERSSLLSESPENELPPQIVFSRVDGIGVAQPVVPLEQHRHRQQRWLTRLLPAWVIAGGQLLLEFPVEQLFPDLPEESIELARGSQVFCDLFLGPISWAEWITVGDRRRSLAPV